MPRMKEGGLTKFGIFFTAGHWIVTATVDVVVGAVDDDDMPGRIAAEGPHTAHAVGCCSWSDTATDVQARSPGDLTSTTVTRP